MKIEILEKNDNNFRLIVRDADVALMNALRRIGLAEFQPWQLKKLS